MKSLLVVALGLAVVMGCNTEKKAPEAFTLTPLPAPTPTNGGIRDPSIKPLPAPLPTPVTKGGIPDDSIKPIGKTGIPDDSIKPVPR